MTPIVTAKNVSKQFLVDGRVVSALEDVSLDVAENEVVSVLGPSGCGKTTLLRILSGILPPTEGTVSIAGAEPEQYRRHTGIGFVFQRPVLLPWRTLLQNALLPSDVRKLGLHEDRARDTLHLVGLQGFEGSYPNQLSGGMLQRAAFARALTVDPGLLLLDEPFSSLDDVTREKIWCDLENLWSTGRPTTILVTHSVREAVFFGDRVSILSARPGRLLTEFPVKLDRPRTPEIARSSEFSELCRAIRTHLGI